MTTESHCSGKRAFGALCVGLFLLLLCLSPASSAAEGGAAEGDLEVSAEPEPEPDIEQVVLEEHGDVPLSGLRFIGTHNSYHRWPRFLGLPFFPFAVSAKHRYAHPSLTTQLEGGERGERFVRQLEIDVHMRRLGNQLRVFHLPWIDNRSSCKTFEQCLVEIRTWSESRNGRHAPVLIWIEPKDETPLDRWLTLGYYERVDLMRVEAVILEVMGRERVLTPDDVRRGEPTLPDALAHHGWPSLEESRGKFLFSLLDEDRHRAEYTAMSPQRNLEGRVMFVRATQADDPFAATFKINNAVPTLREMQAFGRDALENPELAALQVFPEPETEKDDGEISERLASWWKNLWDPLLTAGDAADAEGESEGDTGETPAPQGAAQADLDADAQREASAEDKNLDSEEKPEGIQVDRHVRRTLASVHAEARAEERERHVNAVAELEEKFSLADSPESEELALVLENARRSKDYREVFLLELKRFLDANERAEILRLVRDGFLVTTTADDADKNDDQNRERAASALLSAAQFISTDALLPRDPDDYVFEFPGGAIRCNGLIDAASCHGAERATP